MIKPSILCLLLLILGVTSKHIRFLEETKKVEEGQNSGNADNKGDGRDAGKDETKQKDEYTTKVVHMSEVPGQNLFQGPLFIGSQNASNQMIYDTMSSKITINVKECQGALRPSTYATEQSTTDEAVRYQSQIQGKTAYLHQKDQLHFGGQSDMQGYLYKERMCLHRDTYYVNHTEIVEVKVNKSSDSNKTNSGNSTNSTTGNNTEPEKKQIKKITTRIEKHDFSICVKKQIFLAVDLIKPEKTFPENGVLGLAPNKKNQSIVNIMKEQGLIDRQIVTLNLEDNVHKIEFGTNNGKLPKYGTEGVKQFSNVGQGNWALMLDHIQYNDSFVRLDDTKSYKFYVHSKMAYIDSGNSSIQLPMAEFNIIKDIMMSQESSIKIRRVPNTDEDQERFELYSLKTCKEIQANLKSLELIIQTEVFRISSQGLLFQVSTSTEKEVSFRPECRIGIESIPDSANHYRLGIQFLRNFFVQLDYEQNIIMIGLNNNGKIANSGIVHDPTGGYHYKPKLPNYNYETMVNIIMWTMVVILVIIGLFYYLQKKNKNSIHIKASVKVAEYTEVLNPTEESQLDKEDQATMSKRKVQYAQQIQDHNMFGDDVTEVKNYDKLNRYQKFEKLFPFFRMDINGFIMNVKNAVKIDLDNKRHDNQAQYNLTDNALLNINHVTIQALSQAFTNYSSWRDLGDPTSNFVRFLLQACMVDDQENLNNDEDVCQFIDLQKLKILGILLCEGKPKEKAFELFDVLQDNFQDQIAFNDKDFKPTIESMFYYATEIVFYYEPYYMSNNDECPVSEDQIQNAKQEYATVLEEFIDAVFDQENQMPRKAFEDAVVKTSAWIFNPQKIRSKLYPDVLEWN